MFYDPNRITLEINNISLNICKLSNLLQSNCKSKRKSHGKLESIFNLMKLKTQNIKIYGVQVFEGFTALEYLH